MKIRTGFVSNSSSSSFIIHSQAFENETCRIEFLRRLEQIEEQSTKEGINSWNDCGQTYETEGDFIIIGTHNAPGEVYKLIDEYIVNKSSTYDIYG